MSPETLELTKFLVGAVTTLGAILGSAKVVGSVLAKAPVSQPNPVYEARFTEGEKRMDRLEGKLETHDQRFSVQDKEHAALRVELAELRPHFHTMREAVTILGKQARDMEGTLNRILAQIPEKE